MRGVYQWKFPKSKKANAALTGLGNRRRIILADPLLDTGRNRSGGGANSDITSLLKMQFVAHLLVQDVVGSLSLLHTDVTDRCKQTYAAETFSRVGLWLFFFDAQSPFLPSI